MCQQHQHQPSHHAEAGPTVGQDVLAVGLQNDGIGPPAGSQQIVAQARVDDSGRQDHEDPGTEIVQLQPCDPLPDRLKENCDRGHNDQRALKPRREERDALVAVEEMMRSWPGAETKTETGKRHGNHMDHRFSGIGEDGRRMRHQIGCHLAGQHGKADQKREKHGEAHFPHLQLISLRNGTVHGLPLHVHHPRARSF